MTFLQKLQRRFRTLFAKEDLDAEMDKEMRTHLDMQTQENIDAGMTEEEARRAAFRDFGHLEGIQETCREQREGWLGRQLSMVEKDVRFALRQLRKSPGFTAVAIFTLALGIGSSTAIYSVLNHVVLNPVPGPEPDRLLQIHERLYNSRDREHFTSGASPPVLAGLRANQEFFAEFATYESALLERRTEDFVDQVQGTFVSPNFFTLWGVPPMLGRTFAEDEAIPLEKNHRPAQDSVIVLTHSWWKSLFHGDPEVVGKTVELSGYHFTIIGVMPDYFGFPWGGADFWMPIEDPRVIPDTMGGDTHVLARLKPGTTERQAQGMLDTVAQQVTQDYADTWGYPEDWSRRPGGLALETRPVRHEFQDGNLGENLRRTLFGLLAAIGFVLLIVCANVATLTLARGERRQQEFAVRAALGAGRLRLMRQVLTESVLLGCLGGLGGLLVTFWGMKILMTLVPEAMPRLRPVEVDGYVLGVAFVVSLATGVLFGLVPAWRASKASLGDAVKQAGSMATAGVWRSRYRDALAVVQVALALVLLAGAGLMIQSVVRLLNVEPGYDPENLLRVSVSLPWDKYASQDSPELTNRILAGLHERMAALPGVLAVGIDKQDGLGGFEVDGPAGPVRVGVLGAGLEESDLFRAMGVPLVAGRLLNRNDVVERFSFEIGEVEGVSAVVINETMADHFWPGQDAIGKTFAEANRDSPRTYEVVGVVGDVREYSYKQSILPVFYRPYHEFHLQGAPPVFLIRTAADPGVLAPAIRQELIAAEPAMRTPNISVVREMLYDSTQAQRTYMTYLVVFAGVGLLLSAIGIYGVLAYSVARRTREIGIRMAVGSGRGRVVRIVMTEGIRLIAAGTALGLVAAFWLTRLLENQLFEVSPGDPVVFTAVALVLFLVGLVACLLPALRATRIEPMKALRYE